ncbi:integrase [Francisella halioticida]|nr:integrase [Francisella halioticida]
MLIEPNNSNISIARQCQLLGLHRSVYYYQYKGINEYTEMLMRLIDERYTKYPHEGSRKIMQNLNKQGYNVTRNQVRYLMDKLGLQTIYPKPNTSAKSRDEHKVYPYLLKSICIYYPNQVWCSDITYIRMKHGHIYLVAIMDWYSRYVIDWQLSISLEAEFCIDTLVSAFKNNVCGIMNTDQGSQYTSNNWVNNLINRGVSISMDGKGRCFDNIFIERLWRSVKYECIYLHEFDSVAEVREALADYFDYYNTDRLHQSLDYNTPADVYFGRVKIDNIFDNLTSIF